MPLGRPTRSIRSSTMNRLLQTTASVIATCSTISARPVLLRIRAEKIGLMSMSASIALQLRGGRDFAGAPGWIQAGEHACSQGHDHGDRGHARVEFRQDADRTVAVERAQAEQAKP